MSAPWIARIKFTNDLVDLFLTNFTLRPKKLAALLAEVSERIPLGYIHWKLTSCQHRFSRFQRSSSGRNGPRNFLELPTRPAVLYPCMYSDSCSVGTTLIAIGPKQITVPLKVFRTIVNQFSGWCEMNFNTFVLGYKILYIRRNSTIEIAGNFRRAG